jgi:hypothetical protein
MDLHLKRVYVFCSKSSLLNFKNDSIIRGTAKKNEGSASTISVMKSINQSKKAYNDNLMMDVLIKLRIEMSVMNYKPHRYANVMEFRY